MRGTARRAYSTVRWRAGGIWYNEGEGHGGVWNNEVGAGGTRVYGTTRERANSPNYR